MNIGIYELLMLIAKLLLMLLSFTFHTFIRVRVRVKPHIPQNANNNDIRARIGINSNVEAYTSFS